MTADKDCFKGLDWGFYFVFHIFVTISHKIIPALTETFIECLVPN